MGGGTFDYGSFSSAVTHRAKTGTAAFSTSTAKGVSPMLDPKKIKSSVTGKRECVDNTEYPVTTPIAVFLDVTGSMGTVAEVAQAKLGGLMTLLQGRGYAEGPHIMFGGVGDYTSDDIPFQVGQFESDNRADEQMRSIIIEGGGGGQKFESYELAAYLLGFMTKTDSFDKRGKKGYAFILGDEMARDLSKKALSDNFGIKSQDGMSCEDVFKAAKDKWNLYYVFLGGTTYFNDKEVRNFWERTVGKDHVIYLQDPEGVAETIALTIGLGEGAIDDLDSGVDDLKSTADMSAASIASAKKALVPHAGGKSVTKAKSSGSVPGSGRIGV